MKIMKLWIFLMSLATISIHVYPDTKPDAIKTKHLPIKTTLFFNGRANTIHLVITDDKNKQIPMDIQAGSDGQYHHKPLNLKKIVCREIQAANTTINKADLDIYAVFAFNFDKVEKYHFINIHQQDTALDWVRKHEPKNEALFNEISGQSVYNP